MTRDELLARMSSRELSGWMALMIVHEEEAEYQRDLASSGDGIVKVSGRPDDEDDDGETE